MSRLPRAHPNSAAATARCQGDGCSKVGVGVLMRVRITPKLETERARLCTRCAKTGGWSLGANLPLITH